MLASTRLSTSSWRARRHRVAPSAARTLISRDRATARPRSSPATLTQASIKTASAAPARTPRVDPAVPTISSFRGTARGFQGLGGAGYRVAALAPACRRSSSMAAGLASRRTRPTTL
jgi:hypothetical protein